MRAVIRLALLAALTATPGPAGAVGLGPLRKEGVTDGPDKAFYLTLINPYPGRHAFRVYAVGEDDERPAPRVRLLRDSYQVAGGSGRRFVAIAGDLSPGERFTFRVCAERIEQERGPIHARICSRLTARRLPARA